MNAEHNADVVAVQAGLRKLLQVHGYGFQYALLKQAADAYEAGRSTWLFEVAEFPVASREVSTRVDFVLRRPRSRAFLVVECKRTDPRRSNWCFVSAPYVRREGAPTQLIVEHIRETARETGVVKAYPAYADWHGTAYHLGFEIRGAHGGNEETPTSRNAIDESATQVMRGIAGLTEVYARNAARVREGPPLLLMPVIVTTARLFSTPADLSQSGLSSSDMPSVPELQPEEWVVYQFPLSPMLKHSVSHYSDDRELSGMLTMDHLRSILVVQANAFEKFLSRFELNLEREIPTRA